MPGLLSCDTNSVTRRSPEIQLLTAFPSAETHSLRSKATFTPADTIMSPGLQVSGIATASAG